MHSAGDSVGGLMVLGLISFIPRQTIGSQVLRRESCERGGSFALIGIGLVRSRCNHIATSSSSPPGIGVGSSQGLGLVVNLVAWLLDPRQGEYRARHACCRRLPPAARE